MDVSAAIRLTREGDLWVALLEGLDVASQGSTDREALKNLREAVGLHLEVIALNDGAGRVFDQLRRIEHAHDRIRSRIRRQRGLRRLLSAFTGRNDRFETIQVPVEQIAAICHA